MASTFTPYLNLEQPGQGDQTNTWGLTLNSNFLKIDTGVKTNATNITNLTTTQGSHTTSINTLISQMASSAAAPVGSGLQTQITSHTTMFASTAAAPVTSGLQTQITAAQSLATTANSTANTANALAGTANTNATNALNTANTANANANSALSTSGTNSTNINTLWAQMGSTGSTTSGLQTQITANANAIANLQQQLAANVASQLLNMINAANANITTLQQQMATTAASGLNNRINVIAAAAVQVQVRTQHVAGGSMTGDWVIMRQFPFDGSANAVEFAFGRGEAKGGDTIQLPTGFSSSYVECAVLNAACPGDMQNFYAAMSGLTVSSAVANNTGSPSNYQCIVSWWGFSWRTGVT